MMHLRLDSRLIADLGQVAQMDSFEWTISPKLSSQNQGCQIFLSKTHQKEKNYTNRPQNVLNGDKIYKLAVK
jgi:hypothetical protein